MNLPIFPDLKTMAWNNTKTMRWDTKIQKSGSGRRKTLSRWSYPEWSLECSYTCLDQKEIEEAAGFFAMVRGQHQPFLWKDMEDYREENVRIGVGDGQSVGFHLVRNYANLFVEPVGDILLETLEIYVDDESAEVSVEDGGWVELATPPASGAIVTATFEYYWRVAFADDELDWANFWYSFYKLNKVGLVTVR
ncbi:MAG TPA: hypothetical protein DD789_04020 [Firmicutes bacterium]|jgi:uncharacterized protein (TIGR02217 family)|nr:hypothetical protein [Bacillota bacterium]